jgi:energy-coupling factor transporter transmembrane protein EcfT
MNSDFIQSFLKPQRTGNYIQDLNPLSKFNILLILGIAPFIVNDYRFGFGISVVFLIIALAAQKLKPFFKVYWKIALLFGVFLFLVRACFSPGENVLFQFIGIKLTTEGIAIGLQSSSLVLAFSGAIILFVQLTPMNKLMYALEKKGMSHVVSYITLSSFQTIADLGNNAKVIMESQKSRGIETDGNVFQRIKAYVPVLGPLVLNAISSTEEKAIAMDARAFSAPVKHTFLCDLPPVSIGEKVLVCIFNLAFIMLIVWRFVL